MERARVEVLFDSNLSSLYTRWVVYLESDRNKLLDKKIIDIIFMDFTDLYINI